MEIFNNIDILSNIVVYLHDVNLLNDEMKKKINYHASKNRIFQRLYKILGSGTV